MLREEQGEFAKTPIFRKKPVRKSIGVVLCESIGKVLCEIYRTKTTAEKEEHARKKSEVLHVIGVILLSGCLLWAVQLDKEEKERDRVYLARQMQALLLEEVQGSLGVVTEGKITVERMRQLNETADIYNRDARVQLDLDTSCYVLDIPKFLKHVNGYESQELKKSFEEMPSFAVVLVDTKKNVYLVNRRGEEGEGNSHKELATE